MASTETPIRKILVEGDEEVIDIQLNILLDRSGSMRSDTRKTIDSINEYVYGLTKDPKAKYRLTLAQFDSFGSEPTVQYTCKDLPIDQFENLTEITYVPRGNTPLLDAIGEVVTATKVDDKPVLMVIITDGAENASWKFTRAQIKDIRSDKEKANWTFVFLGADIDAFAEAGQYGVSASNTTNFSKSEVNISGLVGATMSYTSNRAMYAASARRSGVAGGQSVNSRRQAPGEDFFSKEDREKLMGEDKKTNPPVRKGKK